MSAIYYFNRMKENFTQFENPKKIFLIMNEQLKKMGNTKN